ncbi:MAG TPA: 1-acyl-sn-glycerol-3-phosphate acyltransferase [Bdellovibrionota bacterium]|nr:1-acyl-sn-glycerol-3-phosphate acyltransferase [Bdellovibrionota bacterium]
MKVPDLSQKALDFLVKYLRLEVHGLEHIPTSGRMICVANHSGFAGLDAIILANEIKKVRDTAPQILAHKLWFKSDGLEPLRKHFGLIRADFNATLMSLQRDEALILFPEGEGGNFKPTRRRYRLQDFRGGFARAALITGAPIVPCVIVGAEESNINLGRIRIFNKIIGTDIPLPLNLIPLPIKWSIKFLPPRHLEGMETEALDNARIDRESLKMRHHLQRALVDELRRRKSFHLGKVPLHDDDVP